MEKNFTTLKATMAYIRGMTVRYRKPRGTPRLPSFFQSGVSTLHRFRVPPLLTFAALSITALGAVPALAQSSASLPITVAVIDNYPAFRPHAEQPDPRARELRAVAIRRDPVDKNRSIILLNPVYLTPETLSDALVALRAAERDDPPAESGTLRYNFIPLDTARRARPLPAQKITALNAKLAELRAQPASHIYKLGGVGRSVVISDLSQYLPTDK